MGDTPGMDFPDAVEFLAETLDFDGSVGDLPLNAGDLHFKILQGYQVPKIRIHLLAPSRVKQPEEDMARLCGLNPPRPEQLLLEAIIDLIASQRLECEYIASLFACQSGVTAPTYAVSVREDRPDF